MTIPPQPHLGPTLNTSSYVPVVTPAEMAEIDQQAIGQLCREQNCSDVQALEILIRRAGEATAAAAREILGSCYGKQVLLLAGKGNNGKDGISAAERLSRWGAKVVVVPADGTQAELAGSANFERQNFDLIIDAAYGTGLSRPHKISEDLNKLARKTPVLAVDIPSGIDGLTGEILGEALPAQATITFAALKPGHLLADGPEFCGDIKLADIGLNPQSADIATHLLTRRDLRHLHPKRQPQAHKWQSACWVVGGSAGMTGALALCAEAAYRAGSGYVRYSTPNSASSRSDALPVEAVGHVLSEDDWAVEIISELEENSKFRSLVVGPGLVATESVKANLVRLIEWFTTGDEARTSNQNRTTLVLDGGALQALGDSPQRKFNPNIVLTPHDREFEYLQGRRPGADRIAACRDLAASSDAVVLLKGPTTIISHPNGQVLLSGAGDSRLATAGTGDVLSGVIAALAAQGLDAFEAAAAGAELHGQACQLGLSPGLTAGDLPLLVARVRSEILVSSGAAV